jgi:transcriptional regulator CtsR
MKNISDVIEQYLKQILMGAKEGYIEIQRSQLAEEFNCVPSQINYVISTRFTVEKGYHVESKRGGGGFIRIRKVDSDSKQELLREILTLIGEQISQSAAESIIDRLHENGVISTREREIMKVVISRRILNFNIPVRDELRARMMKCMLISLLSLEEGEGN